ncbi:hypothetical protein ACLK1T_14995 [Escherichia coli]
MIPLIHNDHFFTWNLYQYFCELGRMCWSANDALTLADIDCPYDKKLSSHLGPVCDDEAGISLYVIRHYACACQSWRLPRSSGNGAGIPEPCAAKVMHGKTSPITHNGEGVFRGWQIHLP